MPAPKGSRNARKYQEQHVSKTVIRLNEALSDLKASGILFQNVTNLSKYLGKRVNISNVSLLRNVNYRRLLDRHLVSQPGAASILTRHQKDVNVLMAKITALQLENSNKAQDLKRLEAALAIPNSVSGSGVPNAVACNEVEEVRPASDFSVTAQLALALINWLPGIFVDYERRVVFDPHSTSGEDVVATEELAGPFIDWMLSNQPQWVVDATRERT